MGSLGGMGAIGGLGTLAGLHGVSGVGPLSSEALKSHSQLMAVAAAACGDQVRLLLTGMPQ